MYLGSTVNVPSTAGGLLVPLLVYSTPGFTISLARGSGGNSRTRSPCFGMVTAIAYRDAGGMSRVVPSPYTGLPTWVYGLPSWPTMENFGWLPVAVSVNLTVM